MKILVCGSRYWKDSKRIDDILSRVIFQVYHDNETTILEGGARGADRMAYLWAKENGIECIEFPADWKKYGLAAGPIRNRQMLDEKPDMVLAFHNSINTSKGTLDTLKEANKRGIPANIVTRDSVYQYFSVPRQGN
jgi:hypothetical protein